MSRDARPPRGVRPRMRHAGDGARQPLAIRDPDSGRPEWV
jgi:hypothetical protein